MSNSQEDLANMQSVIDADKALNSQAPIAPAPIPAPPVNGAPLAPAAPEVVDLEAPVVPAAPGAIPPPLVVEKTKAQIAKEKKDAAKAEKDAKAAAAKAEKEAKAAADKEAKDAAKAEKEAKVKVEKIAQPQQNGVTMPKADTACGKIWAICDAMSKAKGERISKKEVAESEATKEFNQTTIGVQYYKWKTYYGF